MLAAVEPDHDLAARAPLPRLRHDHDRARSVRCEVTAHRTQDPMAELADPAASDHDKPVGSGEFEERVGRMTFDDEEVTHDVTRSDQIDRLRSCDLSGGPETHPIDVGERRPASAKIGSGTCQAQTGTTAAWVSPPSRQPSAAPPRHRESRRLPPATWFRAPIGFAGQRRGRSVASSMMATY